MPNMESVRCCCVKDGGRRERVEWAATWAKANQRGSWYVSRNSSHVMPKQLSTFQGAIPSSVS